MNYETFKSAAVSFVQKFFGSSATVSIQVIRKNNDIQLDGLIIQEDSVNISPTIYLNYYYEDYLNGMPMSSICQNILDSYQENKSKDSMDLSFFTDYEKAKNRIIYRLIHFEKNQELLKDLPHFRFLDLAVVFSCLMLDTPNGNATILIHHRHLEFWNITADELYKIAVENTPRLLPFELKSLKDILSSSVLEMNIKDDAKKQDTQIPMYVLTNASKLYGASCILYPNVLADFSKEKNCDLYIIPSSIHEVLLVPADSAISPDYLNNMVKEVNDTSVLTEEILCDHVYFFSKKLQIIRIF